MESLVIKLAWLAKLQGLRQSDLASECEVSRVTINRFFKNRSELRASDFCKLLAVLGIDIDRLIALQLENVSNPCNSAGTPDSKQRVHQDITIVGLQNQ